MADYFQSAPNFTNPAYATPEQLAAQRAYAEALTKRSGEPVNRPAGAAANMINMLTAGLTRNDANTLQQQAAQGNARNFSDVISQLQRGGPGSIDPQNLGHIIANPMVSPEQRALALRLMTPEPVKSEFGQPGFQSPATGVQATPIQGPYTPGYRVEQGAEGVHSNAPVPLAPMPSPAVPVPSTSRVWGTKEGERAGLYPTPQAGSGGGGPASGAGLPPAPAPAVPNTPMSLDQLAAKGREFAAQKAFTQGGAEAVTGVAKQDIEQATNAPAIKRISGMMLDDLRAHPEMTTGPSAEISNNVKRFIANYAPNLLGDKQLHALASADSFDKLSAQLTTMLANSGRSDAALFNSMKSVPGAHNSREGAEALLLMQGQVADQATALRQATAAARNHQEYEALRTKFFEQPENQIVNPLTGHPIKQDLETQKTNTGSGGFKVLKVH